MPKGGTCVSCSEQTAHIQRGGVRVCSKCGTLSWAEGTLGPGTGGGKGRRCGGCGESTLQWVLDVKDPAGAKHFELRKCSSCNFAALIPGP